MNRRLRVLVLTQGGCELAVTRLLELESAEIAGIFVETDIIRRRSLRDKIIRSIRYDGYSVTAVKLVRKMLRLRSSCDQGIASIENSRDQLRKIGDANNIPVHFVDNFNSERSMALMREVNSDLGVVLGTNILKESVFSIPRLGSINLHQGLAPYYRGCPSIFWELRNGEREVGLTVHLVQPKVDTGDIILQRTVPLEYDYSYQLNYEAFIDDYRQKLKAPCASLLADAIEMIAEGSAAPRPQATGVGKRYRLPTKREKNEMRRCLRERRRFQVGYALAQKQNCGD